MTPLTFDLIKRVNNIGLYGVNGAGEEEKISLYFLLVSNNNSLPVPPNSLSLAESWSIETYAGCYLFAPPTWMQDLPEDGIQHLVDQLVDQEKVSLDPRHRNIVWVVPKPSGDYSCMGSLLWVKYPNSYQGSTTLRDTSIELGNLDFYIPLRTTIELDLGSALFRIGPQSSGGMNLQRGKRRGLLPEDNTITVALDGLEIGAISFSANWKVSELYDILRDNLLEESFAWGGEVRYFFPNSGNSGNDQQLRYPLFLPSTKADEFSLKVQLDPLNPSDGSRTQFLLNKEPRPGLLESDFFRNTASKPNAVKLKPFQGVGFHLGKRPKTEYDQEESQTYFYLAPMGEFQLDLGGKGNSVRLMCGLSGMEYIMAWHGDIIEFIPSQPAFALGFGHSPNPSEGETASAQLLTSKYTTSWVRFKSSDSSSGQRGYLAQPNASVFYGHGAQAAGTTNYPTAVSPFVSDLKLQGGEGEPPIFPMVAYGGIYPKENPEIEPINSDIDPDIFQKYEHQILTGQRHAVVVGSKTTGPIFLKSDQTPISGATTMTPQGLLVQLNHGQNTPSPAPPAVELAATQSEQSQSPAGAGTWQHLHLAKSGDKYLSFNPGPGGVVNQALANALMHNQLFLVLSNWNLFDDINKEVSAEVNVGGFNFKITPSDATEAKTTILVFKYSGSKSLEDLIKATPEWNNTQTFVGDASEVSRVQGVLQKSIKIAEDAKGTEDDPFAHFRDVISTKPEWTGIISFNSPIDGSGMPPDLQMLFAGIDGQLEAHHFGVEVNHIRQQTIEKSSLFGVINYIGESPKPDQENKPAFHFEVLELRVVFQNSIVTQFHAKVGMTINQLFGRQVNLVTPVHSENTQPGVKSVIPDIPNTIVISGQYQKHGQVGTVTFDTKEPFQFESDTTGGLVRVLQNFKVTDATLVPISQNQDDNQADDSNKTIKSHFVLAGEFDFNQNPFPKSNQLDLFSYGENGKGLSFSGFSLDIQFQMDSEGKKVGDTTITADMNQLLLNPDSKAIRPGSLLKNLPLKLKELKFDSKGINSKSLGGSEVHCVELIDYSSSAPTLALKFELPLGSLGGLSEIHAGLTADLFLAWGPSSTTPDNDGAALFVQLPKASVGYKGFNLEGILKATFGDANLMKVDLDNGKSVYVVLFNNVALSVLGIKLPPKVIIDFILFSGANQTGPGNLAWNLAATQVKE